MSVLSVVEPPETLADLLKRLGDIPPERVRMQPPPGLATEQDLLEAESRTNRLCELVDRVLVEKPMGYYASRLAAVLIGFMETFLRDHDLGIVLAGDGMVRVERQVRLPDVSFLSWDHFPGRALPRGAILDRTPDLVVEVISPGNTEREMERKRREYFAGGARLVWQVYPEALGVRVYTTAEQFTELGEDGTLDGGDVLPGFALPIRQWFERAGRRQEA
jgi:Uma2 family endonuclease